MTVRLFAPAKLTLELRVTGVRDDGYHVIDAEMSSLDLHDVLTIVPGGTGLTAMGPHADDIPLDDANLVSRALQLTGRSAHVTIDKQIPPGGGLGGGSADAAAILRWAGVIDVAATVTLGSDVPFCMVGGRARVRGVGEIVEPLAFVDRQITLVMPPLGVDTASVYRRWDELGGPAADGPNDLEPAALAEYPVLARWRDVIGDATGETPMLAGSGATWFVHGEHSNALTALGEGARVVVARTIPGPERMR